MRHDVFGVKIDSKPLEEVITEIRHKIQDSRVNKKPRPFFVVTVNPEFVIQAQEDNEFKNILNSADLAVADGVGLRLVGIRNIVPGRKIVEFLVKSKSKSKIFYLGGKNGVARKMAEKYGGEWDEGEQDVRTQQLKNPKTQSNIKIINKINKYRPDVLFVAYGAPWQEKWIQANLDILRVRVVMGVGGTFDFLVGETRIAPEWMSKYGLEWLWRLIQEPWRWRRQMRLIKFLKLCLLKS